jgi:hypothetical protein
MRKLSHGCMGKGRQLVSQRWPGVLQQAAGRGQSEIQDLIWCLLEGQ